MEMSRQNPRIRALLLQGWSLDPQIHIPRELLRNLEPRLPATQGTNIAFSHHLPAREGRVPASLAPSLQLVFVISVISGSTFVNFSVQLSLLFCLDE